MTQYVINNFSLDITGQNTYHSVSNMGPSYIQFDMI